MKHLETLVNHMEWLIELQRDADVQDAIGWVIADNARLRKAIEEVLNHDCASLYPDLRDMLHNALEGK